MISNNDCVVTGCDQQQEWMLPWWYNNYSKHNQYQICFGDFGLSPSARRWCSERGVVIPVGGQFKINWFKKPFAILGCGYQRVIWTDLDCEIRADIKPIFEAIKDFAVAPDPYMRTVPGISYQTGVVAVLYSNRLVSEWANACLRDGVKFRGDQELLNSMISKTKPSITVLPRSYHWLRLDNSDPPGILIKHWTGPRGKEHIRTMI